MKFKFKGCIFKKFHKLIVADDPLGLKRAMLKKVMQSGKKLPDSRQARWQLALLWASAVFEHDMWPSERWLDQVTGEMSGKDCAAASSAD